MVLRKVKSIKAFVIAMFVCVVGLAADVRADLPRPGDLKVDVVPINIRFHDSTRTERIDQTFQPNSGWQVVRVEVVEHSRLGNTNGPSYELIQGKGETLSREYTDEQFKSLYDYYGKMDAQLKDEKRQEKLQALAELRTRTEQEEQVLLNRIREYRTSHNAVHIIGSAACRWEKYFGATIFKAGASLKADVKIHQVYIGNKEFLNWRLEQFKREANGLAN